jgi:hypothetical protein
MIRLGILSLLLPGKAGGQFDDLAVEISADLALLVVQGADQLGRIGNRSRVDGC